jgi:hypothetical protein
MRENWFWMQQFGKKIILKIKQLNDFLKAYPAQVVIIVRVY